MQDSNFGQVLMETELGHLLYDVCKNNQSVNVVVEIGTWYGLGSTKCIIQGLIDSKKSNISFASLEIRKEMHDTAIKKWNGTLPKWAKLIHGRVVELQDIDMDGHGDDSGIEIEDKWLEEDKNALLSCENVLDIIPPSIDFLFLDGGGYTTTSEFHKLKDRSMAIILDDTNTIKGKKIRDIVLQNPKEYEVVLDKPNSRHGIMYFINKHHNKITH